MVKYAVILLLVAFSIGCLEVGSDEGVPAPYLGMGFDQKIQARLNTCYIMPEGEDRQWCLVTEAKNLGEINVCSLVEEGPSRDRCIWAVAKETGDQSGCKDVSNPSVQVLCVAVAEKDLKKCDKIDDGTAKRWCIDNIN